MPQFVDPIDLHAASGLRGDQQLTTLVDQIGYIFSVVGTTGEARQSLTTILTEFVLQSHSPTIFPVTFASQAHDLLMLANASATFVSKDNLDLTTQALETARLASGTKSPLAILHRFPVGQRMLVEVTAVLASQRTEEKVYITMELYTRQLEEHNTTPVSMEKLQQIDGWHHNLGADIQQRLATCGDATVVTFHTALNMVYENWTADMACKWPEFFTFEGWRDARSGVFSVFTSILAVSAPVHFRRAPFVLPWR